jgi:hypothetical protein
MKFVLFIGWVLLIFICSDLVGSALRFRLSLLSQRQASAIDHGRCIGKRGAPVDFVHSTLLGFATLWLGLSVAYAIGIATQGLIVAFIGFSAVAAALAQYRNVISWAHSRLTLWGLVAAVALLASFVTPFINPSDDPEYFFLINKLLRTGSVVEYFNVRRPITLGGWTFIQAIFSAGPAGVAFVASIDAIVGGILFLFCAILVGTGEWAALPAALIGVLVVQVFQNNLGTAIGMAALCAVFIGLSLPACAPRSYFTTIAIAVMAVTIRPQLGLIAIIGIAVVLWRNRSTSWPIVGAILAGISTLWIAIFLRDTGLLPLSMSPSYNPQFLELYDVPLHQKFLLSQLASLGEFQWAAGSLTLLAVVICGWQSVTTKHSVAIRNEFLVLGAFSIAVVATVVVMLALLGPLAPHHERYYVPVVEGFLYVFLIRSAIHLFQRVPGRLSRYAFLPIAVTAAVLCLAIVVLAENGTATEIAEAANAIKLSVPAESSGRICSQLLTPEERRAFERIPTGSGYTLLALDCPIGSFETSSRVMLNDIMQGATRGDYFDIAWGDEKTVDWLQKQGVDQLVYLDNDASDTYSIRNRRTWLERHKLDPSDYIRVRMPEFSYGLEGLEKLRKLAQYCGSVRIPILEQQGPLVIVDVRQCKGRDSRPAAGDAHQ